MRVIAVLNRDGGTFRTTDMDAFAASAVAAFTARGHTLEVRPTGGGDLIAELERAAASAEILLAGGGDGTISAAAAIAFRRGVPLAVLPAGTMNLFARSLGLPLDLNTALEALADGEVQGVDIATANGRPFVHQFSVGLHPKLVKLRESLPYRSRIGKMLASARAGLGAALRPPSFTVEVTTAHGIDRRRVSGLTISNNPFDEGHLPLADHLDRGVLGIYLMKPLDFGSALRLGFGLARGKFSSLPEIIDKEARQATLRFPRKKAGAKAVIDGELVALADRVDLKIHPGGLQVVVPVPVEPAPAETPAPTTIAA
ncbi:MAG: diacylglycerol kinase family protein [Devosia sp.]